MAEDTWYSRAVPILEAVASVEGSRDALFLSIDELSERLGLASNVVSIEVERLLEAGYLSGRLERSFSGDDLLQNARLGANGARVAGAWPSSDPYEALVAVLERRIEEAPDDPTRSRLQKVLSTVRGLATEVGSNVIANVLVEVGKRGI